MASSGWKLTSPADDPWFQYGGLRRRLANHASDLHQGAARLVRQAGVPHLKSAISPTSTRRSSAAPTERRWFARMDFSPCPRGAGCDRRADDQRGRLLALGSERVRARPAAVAPRRSARRLKRLLRLSRLQDLRSERQAITAQPYGPSKQTSAIGRAHRQF